MDKQIIDNFMDTEEYAFYKFGDAYYKSRNTAILERKKKTYIEGIGATVNPFQANHQLASGYFSKIVDQKVNYLLGNGVMFEDDALENAKDDYVSFTFDTFMQELASTSAKKGVSWAYMYYDKAKLMVTEVQPEQIVPCFNESGKLEVLYRVYTKGNKEVVEEWTDEEVKTYVKDKKGYSLETQTGHYTVASKVGSNVIEEKEQNFSTIPFIPLWNEPDKLSDLARVKGYIDIYDIIASDFANNIDDMQDAFFTIKNYNGEGLDEFLKQLKAMKAVPVGEDGEVTAQQLKIPVEARDTFLKLAETNIFKFSMSVDTTTLAGSSLTNVAIQAQFTDLDLKADKFETQIAKFLKKLINFINAETGTSYDWDFTLERSMIVNREDIIRALKEQGVRVSNRTLLKAHPLVDDLDEELELVEQENQAMMIRLGDFDEEETA